MSRLPTVLLAGAMLAAARLPAQDAPPTAWGRGTDAGAALSPQSAAWLGGWSPLRPIADMPRGLLRAPLAPGLLDAPRPMAGAFFLVGAPGALARGLPVVAGSTGDSAGSPRFAELRLRAGGASGGYRRPLDIGSTTVGGASGQGWSRTGTRTFLMGRFAVDRERADTSAFTARVFPYASSPFVATDSVTPPMQRTRMRLEGAIALRLGDAGVGVAAGLESREQLTIDYPLRRTGRGAMPAVTSGVDYRVPGTDARIGVFHRWTETVEMNTLNSAPLGTTYSPIRGFDEPLTLSLPPSNPIINVKSERRANALGGTLDATVLGTRLVVSYESGRRYEDSYSAIGVRSRPSEEWRAEGSEIRGQFQRPVGARVHATVVGFASDLTGTAERPDLTGIAFRGSDARQGVEGDVRVDLGSRWRVGVLGGLLRTQRDREDLVAERRFDLESTMPFGGFEIVRGWRARSAEGGGVALGASLARSSASGNVPPVAGTGPKYQLLIAPELAYEAATASATAVWGTVAVPVRTTQLIASVRVERASPVTVAAGRLQPSGTRNGWSASLGVLW